MTKESRLLEQIDEAELTLFKRKLKKLKQYKGRGTELISLYLPPEVDRSSVMAQITEETSQSGNIKSPQTRKNVQGALRKLGNFLKQINFDLPKNGLVVFVGNISEQEGGSDIRLFTLKPPKELKTKLYWCDSEFHLAPLEEMIAPTDIFGILTMDKKEATIAILAGKKYEILAHFTSGIGGKHHAGGQCLAPDSLVQLSDGSIVEIAECHNPSAVKTADFNELSIKDSFIKDKWETVKPETLAIYTKEPRMEILCSADHSLFCWENGEIKEKKAAKLREGQFLLMPERIKISGAPQRMLNNFFNSFIVLESGREKLREARTKQMLSQKALARKAGLFQANISALELGKFCPRYGTLEKICALLGIDFNSFTQQHCRPNSKIALPNELNEELAQFAGYFLGDGCFEKERIRLFEERKEVAEKYRALAEKIFNAKTVIKFRESKNYFAVTVYGKPVVKYLQENFPELGEAAGSIPRKVLKSDDRILGRFLRGLFDAEGYVSGNRTALGMNNGKLTRQLQMALLRFSILPGLYRYDNRRNPYSKNTRFTIQLSEKKSLELFRDNIGFTSEAKAEKLRKAIARLGNRSSVRQIVFSGKQVREIIGRHNAKVSDFPHVTNFFRDERLMSKQTFENSIMKYAKNEELLAELGKVLEKELLPVKIKRIEKTIKPSKMIDVSVDNQNFIANGLIVHNSAQRFERLHEEAVHDFYKRIAEKMNETFLPYEDKLKGLLVAGPGITKNYFLNAELLDHRLKGKVIGTIDASYTDESGIREAVNKSDELLKDAEITKERGAINNFLGEVVKPASLAAYGQREVEEALAIGKVAALLLSEALEWMVYKFKCNNCNEEIEIVVKDPGKFDTNSVKCRKCNSTAELIEEVDYTDWMVEKAHNIGAETKIISTDTSEGEQFLRGFGGIGAILRYK